MYILAILFIAIACMGLFYALLSYLLVVFSLKKRKFPDATADFPPISVFKPLKGQDENLYENLESLFHQEYPTFELLFGVHDKNDPAIAIVRKLMAEYPQVPARLVIDPRQVGLNPKVNNLCNIAPCARHEFWVINDSNVRVERHYLTNLVQHIRDHRVGLVTSLIRGVGENSLGAALENLYLNSFIAAGCISICRLSRIPVTIGKSMLIRRNTVQKLGGFKFFADYLIEDGLLGRQVRNLGLRTALCLHPVDNVNRHWTLRDFLHRNFRWALMRRHLNVWHYTSEILANPIVFACAAVLLAPSIVTMMILAGITALKILLDILTVRAIGGSVRISSVYLLLLKDILTALVWCRPFFDNRVSWRGHYFRLGDLTRIIPEPGAGKTIPGKARIALNYSRQTLLRTTRRLVAWGTRVYAG